jgi:hypothetical protein
LGNDNSCSAFIEDRHVKLAFIVFENTQGGNFLGQETSLFFVISLADPNQDDKSGADFGDGAITFGYLPGFHPLNKCAHIRKKLGRIAIRPNKTIMVVVPLPGPLPLSFRR